MFRSASKGGRKQGPRDECRVPPRSRLPASTQQRVQVAGPSHSALATATPCLAAPSSVLSLTFFLSIPFTLRSSWRAPRWCTRCHRAPSRRWACGCWRTGAATAPSTFGPSKPAPATPAPVRPSRSALGSVLAALLAWGPAQLRAARARRGVRCPLPPRPPGGVTPRALKRASGAFARWLPRCCSRLACAWRAAALLHACMQGSGGGACVGSPRPASEGRRDDESALLLALAFLLLSLGNCQGCQEVNVTSQLCCLPWLFVCFPQGCPRR